jgi:hypothetical protein
MSVCTYIKAPGCADPTIPEQNPWMRERQLLRECSPSLLGIGPWRQASRDKAAEWMADFFAISARRAAIKKEEEEKKMKSKKKTKNSKRFLLSSGSEDVQQEAV